MKKIAYTANRIVDLLLGEEMTLAVELASTTRNNPFIARSL